ncbi:RagB/SusD family nutrient uptake outer membrane protein [Rhabdobacter roseus]|uniref:RagB/SusD family nutrient uptake outer membrane protein n=1 Tax=Rhabdobacter roseus TaxID=1655419 RepID=A0A840TU86_9BACT|nr:RagB/SusD family nutrient uptake outer membrane protein [Rhabdobacter roseus]MBB5283608.1 hypothetical protein [Rhabdobacter roseus]
MKRYLSLLLAGLAGLSSCQESYLDLKPTDRYTEQNFWQNEEHALAGLNGTYRALTDDFLYGSDSPFLLEALSPNAYNYGNTKGFNIIAKGNHDANNSSVINNRWGSNYRGIGRANNLLANLGPIPMDEALKKRIRGEALFLRALFYFDLLNLYGGVPLILDRPLLEQGTYPRNSADEIRTQILKDLDEAAASLPLSFTGANKGRATKGAALALKARVLLYHQQWAAAAEAAKAVMDQGTHQLFPDYRGLFYLENEGNAEVVFDVQFKFPEVGNSYDINFQLYENSVPLPDLVNAYLMTDGKSITESPLYDPAKPYENRDPRLKATIITPGSQFAGAPVTATTFVQTGFSQKKYSVYKDDVKPVELLTSGKSELNFMYIRYADVLLMYAEAKNEASGPDASVYEALNKIRTRAKMPPVAEGLSKEQLRQVIRHERRIELAGESLYYHDIRRWKIAENVMNTNLYNHRNQVIDSRVFNASRDYLWPIPSVAIQNNPVLAQNPGYGK